MKLARLASFVHKWLALLVGVQIVFWVVSGFFFTLFPIERIRSEHLVRNASVEAPNLAGVADLSAIHDAQGRPPTKLTIERRAGADVILATYADGPPTLLDAATLRALSPLDADAAARIAQAHITLRDPPQELSGFRRRARSTKARSRRGAFNSPRADYPFTFRLTRAPLQRADLTSGEFTTRSGRSTSWTGVTTRTSIILSSFSRPSSHSCP